MTFSEANREFQIYHKKKHQIILAEDVSHFSFIEKYPLKFHANYKYLVSCRVQQIITVFIICQMQFNNSKHCIMSAKIYCENI